MKENELMVGDWVFVHEPECKGHQVDLIDLANEQVGCDGEIYGFDDIRPIPLTPEILEKNGFVKQGFPGWEIYTENFLILWRNDFPDVLEIRNFNAAYGSFHRSHISYVHDLQHALKLCGIDKEISLC